MPQPIYAAFTGNTLKFLPLAPYRGIIPEGTVINGFPDGIRGSVGVKLVKIEDGMFERVFVDLDGTKNTEYYPVKVTTADLGDGRIREHLTNRLHVRRQYLSGVSACGCYPKRWLCQACCGFPVFYWPRCS